MEYYGVSEFTAKNKLKELLSLGNLKVSLVNKKYLYEIKHIDNIFLD